MLTRIILILLLGSSVLHLSFTPTLQNCAAQSIPAERLGDNLKMLDPTLNFDTPQQNIHVVSKLLTDHILPALTPSELKQEAVILQLPTDLLGISQLLFFRLLLYPDSYCLLISAQNPEQHLVLIASLSDDKKAVQSIIQRKKISSGTYALLETMNGHFVTPEQSDLISFQALQNALQHPKSILNIQAGLARQQKAIVAEPGGFITLEYTPHGFPILHLNFVQVQGEQFVVHFQAATDNWKKLVTLMRENPAEFTILPYQYRSCLNTIAQNISEAKKKDRVLTFADLYLYTVRNSYFPDVVRYCMLLADKSVRGFYVGDFHLHPVNNDVSYQDKVNSKDQRVLVLIPRNNGFDLADLVNVDPHGLPENVIRYRPEN